MRQAGLLFAFLLGVAPAQAQWLPTSRFQVEASTGWSRPLLGFAAANGPRGTARSGQYLTVGGAYQPGELGGYVALTASRYRVDEEAALRQLGLPATFPATPTVTAPWATLSLLAGPQFVLPAPRWRLIFRPLLVGAVVVWAPGYEAGAGTPSGRTLPAATVAEWAWQTGAAAHWQASPCAALQAEVTYFGACPRLPIYGAAEARQLINTFGLGLGVAVGLAGR